MVHIIQSNLVEYSYGNVTLRFKTIQENTLPTCSYYTLIVGDDAMNLDQDEFANLKGIFAKLMGMED